MRATPVGKNADADRHPLECPYCGATTKRLKMHYHFCPKLPEQERERLSTAKRRLSGQEPRHCPHCNRVFAGRQYGGHVRWCGKARKGKPAQAVTAGSPNPTRRYAQKRFDPFRELQDAIERLAAERQAHLKAAQDIEDTCRRYGIDLSKIGIK